MQVEVMRGRMLLGNLPPSLTTGDALSAAYLDKATTTTILPLEFSMRFRGR